ncbi:caspase domain-containing protein [Xylariaceae sp. FL1272]|nr:caspase domain-containing protein [Xylariaceae sp. FL1272]
MEVEEEAIPVSMEEEVIPASMEEEVTRVDTAVRHRRINMVALLMNSKAMIATVKDRNTILGKIMALLQDSTVVATVVNILRPMVPLGTMVMARQATVRILNMVPRRLSSIRAGINMHHLHMHHPQDLILSGYSTVQGYGGTHRAGPPPPQTPQSFGHGAPAGYTFQYSNCTGKRKALLIGINYFGQGSTELKGCINDTKNLSQFLIERYGYKREDMIILTDDAHEPMLQPTKQNMIRAMGWLVDGAQPNDALFLHYSGHGGQTEDLDGDEDDGFDETIYPVDYKQAGHIDDDELHHIVVKPLVAGVRLTAIFDSCHSGSVLDLPYIYSTKGVLKEPNLAAEAGQGLLKAFSSYASGDTGGVASALMGFAKSAYKGNSGYKKTVETKTSAADVIMWSGSKDDQTSADATVASTATGAMSWAFVTALKQDPKQSYVELLNSIRDVLETKYTQKPQLSSSHPLDTDLLFVM